MIWLGAGLGVVFWVVESLLHTFVFDSGPLGITLLGEHDPNELWMRAFVAASFMAFGWVAERTLRAERRLKEDAIRLNRLLRFVDEVIQKIPDRGEGNGAPRLEDQIPNTPAAADADGSAGMTINMDHIGRLTQVLRNLSLVLDERFRVLHALLQLTHEINMGLLLDEVLEKAY